MIGVFRSSVLTLIGLTMACASGGASTETETAARATPQVTGNAISIRVTNDLVPPTIITVWIAPETGSRRRLGTVQPNGQGTFTFIPDIRSMEHHLVADKTDGGTATSNPFTLDGVRGVRWGASSALVNVER